MSLLFSRHIVSSCQLRGELKAVVEGSSSRWPAGHSGTVSILQVPVELIDWDRSSRGPKRFCSPTEVSLRDHLSQVQMGVAIHSVAPIDVRILQGQKIQVTLRSSGGRPCCSRPAGVFRMGFRHDVFKFCVSMRFHRMDEYAFSQRLPKCACSPVKMHSSSSPPCPLTLPLRTPQVSETSGGSFSAL